MNKKTKEETRIKYLGIGEVSKPKEYFEYLKMVYGNSPIKQGLFLLGTILADIQKTETDLNSNIRTMNQINYEGLTVSGIKIIMSKVFSRLGELSLSKDLFIDKDIQERMALMLDRLSELDQFNPESSSVKNRELIIGIMAGYSFQLVKLSSD